MTTFNKATVKTLRDDMQRVMNAWIAANPARCDGLKINVGNASFRDTSVTFKVEVATADEDGVIRDKAASDFKMYASMYDLEPTDLGREFSSGGYRYTLTGINPRATRFPINARRQDGKRFKMPAGTVKLALQREASVTETVNA